LAWARRCPRCCRVSKPGFQESRRTKPCSPKASLSLALASPSLAWVSAAMLALWLKQEPEPARSAEKPLVVRARSWLESGPAAARSLGSVAAQHSPTAPVMWQSRRLKSQTEPFVSLRYGEDQLT
jgi:hypothetical protein